MTTFSFKEEEEVNGYSDEITWTLAEPLIVDYSQRPDAMKVELPNGEVAVFKALRFSKEHIENLLKQGDVTDIYLMFATSPLNANNITIIAGGVVDPSNTGGTLLTGLLYDYCEPCPNKCAAM